MPLCTIPFDPQRGPYLEVFISKPASTFDEAQVTASKRKISMLIDTGASKTAISPSLAAEMQLAPTGKTKLRSATQEVLANQFHVDIKCVLFSPAFYVPDMQIIEFPFADGWRDGFLGRDFLEKVILEINSPEKYIKLVI